MKENRISRRDALKIMGAGMAGIAVSGVTAQAAQLKGANSMAIPENPAMEFAEPAISDDGNPAHRQMPDSNYKEKVVYRGPDLVIRQIDEHTWEGNGHLMYNESIYIVEGEERALLIDAATKVIDLDKIVASITSKPVTLVATHVHPDHTGFSINYFPELYINAADEVLVPSIMPDYKGKVKYLTDGMVFDLGGREIEVIYTPGHTPGSCTFFDKAHHYGFSGDSFGSTNLLLFTNFSTLLATTYRTKWYMEKWGIEKLYPGHYEGTNAETLKRVTDEFFMSLEMLNGTRKDMGDPANAMGLNGLIHDFGVNIRFRNPSGIK